MDNESADPSTQVLVWDCSGDKRLKMPIKELYDKVGTTIRPSSISGALSDISQVPKTSRRSRFPEEVA
jgi:hypothetical protein